MPRIASDPKFALRLYFPGTRLHMRTTTGLSHAKPAGLEKKPRALPSCKPKPHTARRPLKAPDPQTPSKPTAPESRSGTAMGKLRTGGDKFKVALGDGAVAEAREPPA